MCGIVGISAEGNVAADLYDALLMCFNIEVKMQLAWLSVIN